MMKSPGSASGEFARFAALTSCPVCGAVLPTAPGACSACGWVRVCPPVADWPSALKRYLYRLYFERLICAPTGSSDDGFRKMLLGCYRGEWIGEGATRRLVPWSATVDDCYPIALQQWNATEALD